MAVSRGGAVTSAGECFGRVSAPGRRGRIDTRLHGLTPVQNSRMLGMPRICRTQLTSATSAVRVGRQRPAEKTPRPRGLIRPQTAPMHDRGPSTWMCNGDGPVVLYPGVPTTQRKASIPIAAQAGRVAYSCAR